MWRIFRKTLRKSTRGRSFRGLVDRLGGKNGMMAVSTVTSISTKSSKGTRLGRRRMLGHRLRPRTNGEFTFDSAVTIKSKVWLNGEEIFTQANIDTDIHSEPQGIDRHIVPFTLKAGENSILVKVCNETSSWGFHLRITNTDGKPLPDLELTENSTGK